MIPAEMAKDKSRDLDLKLPVYHGSRIPWDDKFGEVAWPHVVLVSAQGEIVYMGKQDKAFDKALKKATADYMVHLSSAHHSHPCQRPPGDCHRCSIGSKISDNHPSVSPEGSCSWQRPCSCSEPDVRDRRSSAGGCRLITAALAYLVNQIIASSYSAMLDEMHARAWGRSGAAGW